jgi:hypothetical protein
MTKLYEDIRGECCERGLGNENGEGEVRTSCIYAKVYECGEWVCPLVAAHRGKRPADMLVERFNLTAQYEAEMAEG